MHLAEESDRFEEHQNVFGFLRLLFASLVIASHVPELVDGDRHREMLTRLTGTMSFGELAVSGFFLISGFLITGSYQSSRSIRSYLTKRVARIYPAFVVTSIFSLLVAAPLGGEPIRAVFEAMPSHIFRMAILARPMGCRAFVGMHTDLASALDGAMWTIQYEVACYLLVILLGMTGILKRGVAIVALSIALLLIGTFLPAGSLAALSHSNLWPGPPAALFRLTGMFLAGSSFYLFRERLPIRAWFALLVTIGFVSALYFQVTAILGVAVFGGYLVLAAARCANGTWVGHVNNETDISYGLYLYAWPTEMILIKYFGGHSLIFIGCLTWLIAATLGFVSWITVEKPFMALARRRHTPLIRRRIVENST